MNSVLPFSYAAIDFIIDRNHEPIFLEANDLGDGIYVLDIINKYLNENLNMIIKINLNESLFDKFVNFFKTNYEIFSNGKQLEKTFIIYHNKYKQNVQTEELIKIKETFISREIQCEIFLPEELNIINNYIFDKKGNIYPQAIFRRTSKLPYFNKDQLIINDPRVRYVTANKYITYIVVKEYEKNNIKINQPYSILSRSIAEVLKAVNFLKNEAASEYIVIKPNWLWGGQGVIFVKNEYEAESKLREIDKLINPQFTNFGKPFIVQNYITPFKIRNFDNRYYSFEIRVFLFNLEIVGLIGRMPKQYYETDKPERNNSISNISSGGRWLPIIIEEIQEFKIKEFCNDTKISFKEPINPFALVLPLYLYNKIVEISKRIVIAISEKAKKITKRELDSIPF